jgi:CrcB protein
MLSIFLVAAGGALGSSARYILTEIITSSFRGQSFPIAIISVNILGSLLAGILHFIIINNMNFLTPTLRLVLMTGFLGGFTTFSAFSLDILRLSIAGQISLACSYAFLSIILSILAVFFGFQLAKLIF